MSPAPTFPKYFSSQVLFRMRSQRKRRLDFESLEGRRLLYSGEFDLQFGNAGIVRTELDATTRWSHIAADSVFQADGKLLATGDGGLTRYLENGSIDPLFGVAGRVSVPFDVRSMVLQADGKILVVGNAVDSGAGDIGVARYLANGNLDTTFDQDGIVIVDFYQRSDAASDIAVQPDGKIVILGSSSTVVVVMARLLANGSLDLSFDGDGKKYFNATRGDFAAALALTADGKMLVLGQSYTSPTQATYDRNLFLARILANGSLDTSFDGDGIMTINIGITDFSANLLVGADGKILIAGSYITGATSSSLLVRLLDNGQFDTTFDGDGIRIDPIATLSFNGNEVKDVAIQNDGKIVVAASLIDTGTVTRYNPNGSLDTTWDSDGLVTFNSIFPRSVSISSTGKILVAGASLDRFAVIRLNANGTVDTTFSLDGRTITSFGPSYDSGEDIIQQPDGKMLVVGQSEYSASVLRYLSNGQLDPTFSGDGKFTFDFDPLVDISTAQAVALQADGKIVVAGTAVRVVGSTNRRSFGIARLNSDGRLDNTFSQDGLATFEFSGNATVRSIKIQADGRIVVAGTDSKSLVIARFLPGGAVDISFGQNGTAVTAIDTATLSMAGMVTLPDGRLLIASTLDRGTGADDAQSILLVRYLASGILDTTFGTGGKLVYVSAVHRSASDIVLQPDGKILVSGSMQVTETRTKIRRIWSVSRLLPNGLSDTTFGENGVVSSQVIGLDGVATSIALQANGRVIVGGQVNGKPAVIRLSTDGSLDSSFGGDGRVPFDVASGATTVNRVRVAADGKAIVLGTYVDGYPTRFESDLFLARLRNDLEAAQATMISMVDGGILVVDQWARDDALELYREGANLVISDRTPDPRATLSIVGVRGSNYQSPKRVSIPWATIQNAIHPLRFWLGLGDDNVQLMTQGDTGDVVPTAGLSIGMDGGNDTIALVNNTTVNNWYLNDANRVAMQLGNLGPVWVSGLDRIIGGDNSDSFVLQYEGAAVIPIINGGLGSDTLHLYRDTNIQVNTFLLPPGSNRVTVDDVVDQSFLIEKIELADIQGGPSDNVIDLYDSDVSAIIRGGGGNDRLYGGQGNDTIYGENGDDLIAGLEGNDRLFGGAGNDVLMGEAGIDLLDGGSGDDLMTGGFFSHLGYYAPADGRDSILAVWRNNTLPYSQRVALLQTTGVGANQQYKLIPVATASDDQSVDTLIGGSGFDWFFAKGSGTGKETDLPQAGVRDRLLSEKLDLL